jgi:aquaglyceroporin related protein
MGGVCGAAIAYADNFHAINVVEGGHSLRTIAKSGDLFAAYPVRVTS